MSSDPAPNYVCDSTPSTFSQSSCVTRVETLQLSQQWKIENFASVVKLALPGNCLRTNMFRDPQLPEACWQLCLYPGGKRAENANHVSLFLKMSATTPSREIRIKVEYRFHFLNDQGVALFSNVNVGEFHAKPPKGGHSWGLRNIPRQKILNCMQDDGSLVISCHIELIPDINRMRCYNTRLMSNTSMRPINVGFMDRQLAAFQSGLMADCVLECDGKQIPVSKFVLTTHSEVFRAMFSYDQLMESTEKRVVIEDAEYEAVRCMMQYMYTGELKQDDHLEGVLALADRYQIDELKHMCERKLCAKIDKNNLLEMLCFADLHNCRILRSGVIDTLRNHRTTVLMSQAWQVLKEANPRLATDVMERAMFGEESPPPPPKRQRHQRFTSVQSSPDEDSM